jgi:O-antigen ligase
MAAPATISSGNRSVATSAVAWRRPAFAVTGAIAASAGVAFTYASDSFSPQRLLLCAIGAVVVAALLRYPELALALYVVIGDVKGDERVAALVPVDLTLALGAVLIAGIALNLLRCKPVLALPREYFLLLLLVAMMTASLTYTPDFDAGVEKLARFLTVTGIVIVAPFFVLSTAEAMKRFLVGFGVVAFVICAYSLSSLGGSDRLVTPSSNTIGLGHIACGLVVLIWFGLMPRLIFPKRMMFYPVLAVALVALVGSGSRGAAMALGATIAISLFYYKRLLGDLACLAAIFLALLPFLRIPEASFEYLGTLASSDSLKSLLYFRAELLDYGWRLMTEHPIFGVGIQGFRFYSPNAGLYNWPHNIFLEVFCELGIVAGVLMLALFGMAIREAVRQARDRVSPYPMFAQIAAALLAVGIVNGTNTGDINSDRSTWLFLSLLFAVRSLRTPEAQRTFARFRPAPVSL